MKGLERGRAALRWSGRIGRGDVDVDVRVERWTMHELDQPRVQSPARLDDSKVESSLLRHRRSLLGTVDEQVSRCLHEGRVATVAQALLRVDRREEEVLHRALNKFYHGGQSSASYSTVRVSSLTLDNPNTVSALAFGGTLRSSTDLSRRCASHLAIKPRAGGEPGAASCCSTWLGDSVPTKWYGGQLERQQELTLHIVKGEANRANLKRVLATKLSSR
ncbi:hypothetical protein GQ600_14425 [Phytophthora cactorum]|nr:hypothetical protein GQ600_14425 [Phytophthora cactorum]